MRFLADFFSHVNENTLPMLAEGTLATLIITFLSTILAYLVGLPLGVLLVSTAKEGVRPLPKLNALLGFIVNILRSVPFLILLIAALPLTRAIAGTTIGTRGIIVPLFIASFPFIARLVEASLLEVDAGVIEAAWSMGSSPFRIVRKVLIPEALPSLINGAAIAVTTILSYAAMSGIVGGGGLGDIAIRYGYYRYQEDIMLLTVIELVVLVQIFQFIGERWAKGSDKRLRVIKGEFLIGRLRLRKRKSGHAP